MSGLWHWRFRNIDWLVVHWMALPGAAGAFLGASVLSSVSTELAKPLMAVLLVVLGTYVFLRFGFGRVPRPRVQGVHRRLLAPLGFFAGFVDATGGGGWGPVATPTFTIR